MTQPDFIAPISPVSHLLLVLHYEDVNATNVIFLNSEKQLYDYLFERQERLFKKYNINDMNDLTSEKYQS